jgi:DNA-binding NarL/FixJ family response regulator
LTQREKQIAEQLTNGLSNKQIARNLSIELSTVKNHVHNILVKMGVESRMQAASMLLHDRIT